MPRASTTVSTPALTLTLDAAFLEKLDATTAAIDRLCGILGGFAPLSSPQQNLDNYIPVESPPLQQIQQTPSVAPNYPIAPPTQPNVNLPIPQAEQPAAPLMQPPLPQYTVPVQPPTQQQFTAPHQWPSQAPTQPVPTSTPTFTIEQIMRAGVELMDRGVDSSILLQHYGVQAISQLSPELYGAFATDLRTMGANI